jgi:hypothetical protein
MADPKGPRPNQSLWPIDSKSKPTPAPKPGAAPASSKGTPEERPAGRVVHDDRGNAVWDWVKETGRVCIESTSAMLKRLEIPGLKMEGEKDSDLRLEEDRDPGGGYDPYNQKKPVPKGKPPTRK